MCPVTVPAGIQDFLTFLHRTVGEVFPGGYLEVMEQGPDFRPDPIHDGQIIPFDTPAHGHPGRFRIKRIDVRDVQGTGFRDAFPARGFFPG